MKKNGFTFVELLAMLVVLGILLLIAIPNISGMLKNQKLSSIKTDATNMVETAKTKASKNKYLKKPKNGECVVFSLSYLNDNGNIEKGPNGGLYKQYDSFVVYTRETTGSGGSKYSYYVRLIETYKGKNTGINFVESAGIDGLKTKDIASVKNLIGLTKDMDAVTSVAKLRTFSDVEAKCPAGIKAYFSSEVDDDGDPEQLTNFVEITGTNTWGNTLTATVVTESDGAISYQWYYNDKKNMTGGTAISGATNSTYVISKDYIGKYIYVKANVAAGSSSEAINNLTDITDSYLNTTAKVAKRKCEAPINIKVEAPSKVSWTDIEGTTGYQISMSPDKDFVAHTNGNNYDKILESVGTKKVYVRSMCDSNYYANEYSDSANAKATVFSVNLTKGTGISSVTGSGNYLSGSNVTISATPANNYSWEAWTTTVGGFQVSEDNPYSAIIDSNWEYTAKGNNSYYITYNNNGGDGCTNKKVNYGQQFGTLCVPSRRGYTFKEWNSKADGTGTKYTESSIVTGDILLYAVWNPNTYTVVYNKNTSTGGSTASSIHQYDKIRQLTPNGYTNEGLSFIGWTTNADGTGDIYPDGATVVNLTDVNNGTVTLYAQWRRIMAENIAYDNTNSHEPCREAQCMIDCIANRLKYGADYDCAMPTNYAFGDSISSSSSTKPPKNKNVYLAYFSNNNKGVCIKRNGVQQCFQYNNFTSELNHIQNVFSGVNCDVQTNVVGCEDGSSSGFYCYVEKSGTVYCEDKGTSEYCDVYEDGSVSCDID